ncbi:MAG: hypothetical protein ABJN51_19765, partial [Sneathiella sp.]
QQEFTNRPGFAKRAVTQTPIIKPLPREGPKGLSGYEIQKAIAWGLPELSAQERDLLQFYVAFLNMAAVKEGKASVWPSNRVTCQLLGISEASLRRYYDDLRRIEGDRHLSLISAHPRMGEPQKQRKSNFSLTVPETDTVKDDSVAAKPHDKTAPVPSGVLKTIVLPPKLLDHIAETEITDCSTDELWQKIDKAIQALLPDKRIPKAL